MLRAGWTVRDMEDRGMVSNGCSPGTCDGKAGHSAPSLPVTGRPVLTSRSGQETKCTSVDPFISDLLISSSLEKPHHFEDMEIAPKFNCQKDSRENKPSHLQSLGSTLRARHDLSPWHSDGAEQGSTTFDGTMNE